MTLTRRSTIAILALLALATVGPVTPANAGGIIERNSFDYAFDDSFKDCGTTIDYHREGTVSSTIRDANGRTGGQFFFYGESYSFRETFTDRRTGDFISASASGRFRELQPRVISTDGSIVTYITKDSGALYNLYDSEGALVARDRGTITERYVFDTLGDSQPGGVFLSEELVSAKGLFQSEDIDFCSLLN